MSEQQIFDLLVVGGGINGIGVARDAAGRGLKVLLCEQDDLANHTSSASTKLIHGGLRYLEHYEFRLVRESLVEREVLLRAAPHIIWPIRIVLPHNRALRPVWMIRLGLWLYDHLGGRRQLPGSERVNLRDHVVGGPLKEDLRTGFVYSDCWVQDSRLVVLNAIDAVERGAEILTRTRCTSLSRSAQLWQATLSSTVDGHQRRIKARCIVNATGPWVTEFLEHTSGIKRNRKTRLVKGSHIVVRKLFDHSYAYFFQNVDQRIVFAIPYENRYTLVGTTEVDYSGNPAHVAISDDEIRYLCGAINQYFQAPIRSEDVVWSYSGVRSLFDDESENSSTVTRDYVLDLDASSGQAPLLSVFGGKITTFRKLAEQVLDRLHPFLAVRKGAWTSRAYLPGGDIPDGDVELFLAELQRSRPWLPVELALRYTRSYGTRTERILGKAGSLDDLGENFGNHLYEAEVNYLLQCEWAMTAEDILWRRSKLGLTFSKESLERLSAHLASNGEYARSGVS